MSDRQTSDDAAQEPRRPLVAIKGDASPEEVAALVAVVQMLAAAAAGSTGRPRARSVWADPGRQLRRPHHSGPGGWTGSALPG